MGKRIISQARGSGSPRYKAPSFKYKGEARHRPLVEDAVVGNVVDIVKCRGHSAPLAVVEYADEAVSLLLAPEGIKVGDTVTHGVSEVQRPGDTVTLKDIPSGTVIYNIEAVPGDGGKFCRSAGAFAKVVNKTEDRVVVELPSKRTKQLHGNCRANIGVLAGNGRQDKPLMKAGNAYYKAKAKNKLYPKVSGGAMNAVDHPFGNARSSRKSKARVAPRNAPPGRKVGMVRARRTGRTKK
ncbi:50S ribosomal protein L2 [Candidatus Woesearchaeota archaeon]|nr:50S ribosomal protein L2 [Candidatus Woesearchaeota archaeon]